jgi:hypothetical protein
MVSAEMLNCKLLSTQAAGIKHLYLYDVSTNTSTVCILRTCKVGVCTFNGGKLGPSFKIAMCCNI